MQVAMVIVWAAKNKTPIVITDWDRTEQEQKVLVARGASKTLKSKHIQGLAIDFVFLSDLDDDGKINYTWEDYKAIGEYGESVGLIWGGRFGGGKGWDAGHFEFNEIFVGSA